jgi:hypothetical protein
VGVKEMQLLFKYENQLIQCQIILRKRKNITIKVDAGGQVTVLAPLGTSKRTIREQVESKARWILKQIEYFKSLAITPHQFKEGELFLYLGREYYLHLEPKPSLSQMEVRLDRDKLVLLIPSSHRGMVKEGLETWYRRQAREKITERIACYEDRIARVPGRIVIKSQKCRWGSCSARGNLNFNWRIIMAPERVVDYIVVHELCHLLELNHSRKFWALVAQIIPDYKENKEWLQKNGLRMNW